MCQDILLCSISHGDTEVLNIPIYVMLCSMTLQYSLMYCPIAVVLPLCMRSLEIHKCSFAPRNAVMFNIPWIHWSLYTPSIYCNVLCVMKILWCSMAPVVFLTSELLNVQFYPDGNTPHVIAVLCQTRISCSTFQRWRQEQLRHSHDLDLSIAHVLQKTKGSHWRLRKKPRVCIVMKRVSNVKPCQFFSALFEQVLKETKSSIPLVSDCEYKRCLPNWRCAVDSGQTVRT